MSLKNNETFAGAIFLIIWILVISLWGASKNITPDLSTDYIEYGGDIGHPIFSK